MWKPLAGRRGRSQWCDASARCGSKRMLVRSYSTAWTASSAQRGERRTREDCHHGERVAVSEGNVAENMTVPRKADRANRLDYKATAATMNDCTATATLSALSITTTRKVSPQRQLLKRKSRLFITNRRQDISIFLTYDTGIECSIWNAHNIIYGTARAI